MLRQFIVSLIVAIMFAGTCFNQTPPPPPEAQLRPSRNVGKAVVTYFSEADTSQAAVLFDLIGKFKNLQTEDNIEMTLLFQSKGKIISKPKTITVVIYHFSMGENAAFRNDHKFTLSINGATLVSSDLFLASSKQLDPAGRYEERYKGSISYQALKKIGESKHVKLKFGDKEIDLDASQLEAISDLNRTIEK